MALGLRFKHEAQFEAEQYLAKAMADPTPLPHQVASVTLLESPQHAEAIAEAHRAIAADPNDANGYIALALSFAGRPAEALEQVERAIPHHPSSYLYESSLAGAGCA